MSDGGWLPAFPGQRAPFERGNGAGLRHGAYSQIRQAPRAAELRDQFEELVPFRTESDGPMLDLLGVTMAQVEHAGLVLAIEQVESARAVKEGGLPSHRLDRLAADMRSWISLASRLLDALGCSPTARARLAGDLAGAQRELTAQAIRERYSERIEAA